MPKLGVNIDHVATVREARKTDEPDPVAAAVECERAGADGITAHLREDRRHIQDADITRLADTISTVLNLELAASPEIVEFACALRPFQATIVPERRDEVTTEGGLALGDERTPSLERLRAAIARLAEAGVRVSLFIDPDEASIDRSAELGVPAIELHTGLYANTYEESPTAQRQLERAAAYAKAKGLAVHAGHGLTYRNVGAVASIPEIEELNIGHSVVSRSITVGMEQAVREMRDVIDRARPTN